MEGSDVLVLQNLINRNDVLSKKVQITSIYDNETAEAVKEFQKKFASSAPGIFGPSEAQALLACCMEDGYKDDGKPATSKGYKYKVHVMVNKNRSIESNATLIVRHHS